MFCTRRVCSLNWKSPWNSYFSKSKRPLFSSSSLGINSFCARRSRMLKYSENSSRFKEHLRLICESNQGLIFMDDIRKMVGLAENDDDLELLFSALKKYCNQKEVLIFQGFNFGPEVMRLLHVQNKPNEAVALVEDKSMFPFFKQLNTLFVLLDLLYNNKKYEEVIRLYEYYQSEVDLPFVQSGLIIIYLASCYKLNTAESFMKALEAHKHSFEVSTRVPLRNALLFAALAIKQNEPVYALETFSINKLNSVVENLKCMAYVQANRLQDMFMSIRSALSDEQFFLINETVSFIEKEIIKDTSKEKFYTMFQDLQKELIRKNKILNKPLDSFLCAQVHMFKRQLNSNVTNSFNQMTRKS